MTSDNFSEERLWRSAWRCIYVWIFFLWTDWPNWHFESLLMRTSKNGTAILLISNVNLISQYWLLRSSLSLNMTRSKSERRIHFTLVLFILLPIVSSCIHPTSCRVGSNWRLIPQEILSKKWRLLGPIYFVLYSVDVIFR